MTALKEIERQIKRQNDQGYYVTMGSLDLSAALAGVKIDLLLRRFPTLGLLSDWLALLEAWLIGRAAFVEISTDRSLQHRYWNSTGFDSWPSTFQSIHYSGFGTQQRCSIHK